MVIEAQASGDLLEPASLPGLDHPLSELLSLNAPLIEEHSLSLPLVFGQQMSLDICGLVRVTGQVNFGQHFIHLQPQGC